MSKTFKKADDNISDEMSKIATLSAKKVYETVKNKFSSSDQAREKFIGFENQPEKQNIQEDVELLLREYLSNDDAFASKIIEYLRQSAQNNVDVVFNAKIKGNVEKITNIGNVEGDVNIN
jgi:hypothetical protein